MIRLRGEAQFFRLSFALPTKARALFAKGYGHNWPVSDFKPGWRVLFCLAPTVFGLARLVVAASLISHRQ
jgi:hypothetical protein